MEIGIWVVDWVGAIFGGGCLRDSRLGMGLIEEDILCSLGMN